MWIYIVPSVAGGLILLCLITALICFLLVFYSPKRKELADDEILLPPGRVYEPFHGMITEWTKEARRLPHEDMEITSFDGLTLRGKYYEYAKDSPLELIFHGYRGTAERDLSGGIERCFKLGRSALVIDQRAHGRSDGRVITFGVRERKDCLSWIDYATRRFGKERKIIITGVSMGAATVMMAAGEDLPENVVCVLADCGYSSAKEIIKKVMRRMNLPAELLYPFVRLGARIYGGFDLEENPPIEAMKRCKVPVIFIHGDTDNFVPFEMSRELFDALDGPKSLVAIPGAGHGLAYPANKELYLSSLIDFERSVGFLNNTKEK